MNQVEADPQRLLRRIADGETAALHELYEAEVDAVYAFVFYRVGREPAVAEEAVQETFTRALDSLSKFDAKRGSVRSWLISVSRNAIRDTLRSHNRSSELVAKWDQIDQTLAQIFSALDREPLSDEVIARSETRDLVNVAFSNLPEHYRDVLEEHYVSGDSIADLAARREVSSDAAKSLLARARRAFRETFQTVANAWAEA